MPDKQYTIHLGFTADINQAKQQMNQLQSELDRLSRLEIKTPDGLTQGLTQANNEVLKLSVLLKKCFNVDTGKLDINKFLVETQQYGMTWEQIRSTLRSFGAEGTQALQQLNAQIAQGQTGMLQLSEKMQEFAKQMKRTMSIQLSYGVMNSFLDTFRDAYSYAQSLNKSLTNIQIVTGKSSSEMRTFAVEANKAAKALSTSTTAYTDAALIYYQQGLNNEQVKERADTTIKLSNVTGQSAEEVSSYMTAIWNNFDDGSKKLEYYADVITALGAATASSSEEIAQGLSQFSAVADTVGLSYEYATAALATVVAQTRQSADTVGNAFKTIFARLESLNLGETLEDDTTLTKYTAALEKVGITVQLENGQLKNMDTILDELGSKWESINSQQKNALAYTVAGARQYTNFIALMDNWGKVQENIGIASGAEGTLQNQADIYAKSWEAASKRLKASWQELYDLLINDDFFITIIDGFSGMINGVNSLIKSLGGLKGILPLVLGLITKLFSNQIAQGVASVAGSVQSAVNIATGKDVELKNRATKYLSLKYSNTDQTKDGSLTWANDRQIEQIQRYNEESKNLNITQQEYNELLQRNGFILKERAEKANDAYADEYESLQNLSNLQKDLDKNTEKYTENIELLGKKVITLGDLKNSNLDDTTKNNIINRYSNKTNKTKLSQKDTETVQAELSKANTKLLNESNELTNSFNNQLDHLKAVYQEQIDINKAETEAHNTRIEAIKKELAILEEKKRSGDASVDEIILQLNKEKTALENKTHKLKEEINLYDNLAKKVDTLGQHIDNVNSKENKFIKNIEEFSKNAQKAVTAAGAVYSLGTAMNGLGESIFNIANGTGSLGSIFSSLISIAGTGIFAFNSLSTAIKGTALETELLGTVIKGLPIIGWLLVLISVISGVVGGISAWHKAQQQKIKDQQEEINKQNELIDSTQQLSQSISDLANEYLSLRDAGKASLDTFKEIEEQLPQLIDYYKELGLETEQLESAFEKAKVTGDISDFLSEKAILDNIVASKNAVNAQENYRNGGKNMATAGTGSHSTLTNTYTKSFKTGMSLADDKKAIDILKDNDLNIGNHNTAAGQNIINLDNAKEMIDYYEKLQKARDEMSKSMTSNERSESEVYQDVIQELNALEESYNTAKAAASEVNQVIAYSVDTGQYESINQILGDGITSIADYKDKHDQLIETLIAEEGITEEEAEAVLRLSSATEEWAKAQSAFKTMAEDAASEAGDKEKWEEYYNDLTSWYDTLENDSDRRLARLIDYTAGMSAEAMNAQLAELKEQQWAQDIKNTISKDGLEEEDFNKYAEHLKSIADLTDTINDELKDNDAAANAVARDIMKMNRGIEALNNGYEDWIDILKNSNKASEEYSNALYDIKSALSDVYDIESKWISSSFVEKNLEKIEKAAQGDADAIEELREALGKDIFENIKAENADRLADAIKNAAIDGINSITDLDNAFNSLQETMNGMRVGDIGSDEFIDRCNEIIAAAGMTAEQATAFFNSMGFETKFAEEPQKLVTEIPQYRTYHTIENEQEPEPGKKTWEEVTRTEIIDTVPVETKYAAFNMTTDGSIPKVESIVKTSHGSMNNFSSTNKGGKSGSKSSSKSSGKSSKKEADRYYTISRQVEKLNKQLDELSKKTDRAFGQAKLDAMQAEIDKYNDLIAANKEYLHQAEEWLAHDRAKLEQYGAQFDANGVITNYEAMFAAHGNDEDGEWAKWLSHYEDSLAKVQEMQEAIAEAQRAIYDKALEAIEYKLEFSIKINDSELKYLEYILNGLEDAAYDSAEAIATLEKKIDNANKKAKALSQNAIELFDIVSPGNGQKYYEQMLAGTLDLQALANEKILNDPNFNAAKWFEDINKLYEELIQNQEDYRQMWKDYIDMMKNFWDSWKENFDKQKKQITDLTKIAEFYKDLVGILGKDELGLSDATMARLDATVSKGRLDEALISYKTFLKSQKTLQEAEEKGLDDKVIEYYKEKVQEAKDELMGAQKAAAQAFVDEYNNALDRVVKNAMDAFSNIGDFDWMKKMYDLELKRNDLYMDTYEKAYQMNKLNNDITRSINEIDGLKTKQELSSLLDEINAKQASGVKMSEYEYEAYRKEYELLLAIQALEDAKNAKNQVRMSRDSEGNMSYVYTADQDAIDAATDNYNDIAYQFAQLNMGQASNAEAQYLALYEQMMEEIRSAGEEHRVEIEEKYAEMLKYWKDQAEVSYKWNKSLMDQMGLDYWDLTVKFEDSVLAHVTGCKTWEELEIRRKETTEQALKDMADADQEYHDKVHDLLEETGLDVDNFEEQVNDDLDDINDGMDDTMDATEDLADEFDDALDDMMDEAENFESKWDSTVKGVIAANDALIKSLGALIQQYNDLALAKSKATGTSYSGPVGGGSGSSGGTSNNDSSTTNKIPDNDKKYKVRNDAGDIVESGLSKAKAQAIADAHNKKVKENPKNYIGADSYYWVSMKTGGYTGKWGPEGRVAMLHEKELVLNSDDTSRMFEIIEAVRDITNELELRSHGANVDLSGTIAGAMASFMNFNQNVYITAEFPNANERNEIEAAFEDLMYRASQYINRK